MPISSLGGFGGEAGRDDRPVAKGDGRRVRSETSISYEIKGLHWSPGPITPFEFIRVFSRLVTLSNRLGPAILDLTYA